jgi:hypothetical protein
VNRPRPLLSLEQLRSVEHPFGWIPCRMLTNGTISSMSPMERQLYLVLALAADRRGTSFYSDHVVQRILGCTHEQLVNARTALTARDLLLYDGMTYQLLRLPPPPPHTNSDQPATRADPNLSNADRLSPRSDQRPRHEIPQDVRQNLRDLFGRNAF